MKKLVVIVLMGVLLLSGIPVVYAGSATLTWSANSELDLAGYRVFRGNAAGTSCPVGPLQPLMINGQQVQVGKVTTYTDTTVPAFDGALCYEITAIDTAGNMSGPSNRATKVVNLVPPIAPSGLSLDSVTP